jgi:hypothetical protein
MADNNIDFEELQQALNAFKDSIHGTTNAMSPMERELKKQEKAFADYKAALKKAQEDQHAAVKKGADAVTDFAKQAMSGGGSFSVLNTAVDAATKAFGAVVGAIPIAGGAMKAFGEAAGDVTKMMIDQFQQGWKAYGELSQTGVVGSFEQLKETVGATGLLFGEVGRTLGKHSKDFSTFGGSVAAGAKQFRETASSLTDVRQSFAAMGISAEEFNDAQAKYMAISARGGFQQQDLAKGTKQYIEQLDDLAKLTGLQKKDIQAQRDAAMSETRFASRLESMSKEQQDAMNDMNSYLISTAGPETAQGFRDLVAAGGVATTDAAKALMLKTNGAAADMVNDLSKKQKPTQDDVLKNLGAMQQAFKGTVGDISQLGQYIGDASLLTKGAAEQFKMVHGKMPTAKDLDEQKKNREKLAKGEMGQTTQLAKTEQNLRDVQMNLQLMATSSGVVTQAMDWMSEGLDELAEKLFEISGAEMPAEMKARKEERKALKEVTKAQRELEKATKDAAETKNDIDWGAASPEGGMMGNTLSAEVDKKRAALEAAQAAANKATANRKSVAGATSGERAAAAQAGNAPTTTVGAPSGNAPTTNGKAALEGLTIKQGDVQADDKSVNPKLIEMAKKVQAEMPGFKYFSAFNDKFHNENSPKSEHTKGLAMDFVLGQHPSKEEGAKIIETLKGWGASKVIDEYNNPSSKATAGHIHAQISARDGFEGLVMGPEEGYKPDIEMHGSEKIKIEPAGKDSSADMVDRLDQLLAKFDDMIDVLEESAGHQKKLAKAAA